MQVSVLPGAATALALTLPSLPNTVDPRHGYPKVNGTPTNTDTEARGHRFGFFASPVPPDWDAAHRRARARARDDVRRHLEDLGELLARILTALEHDCSVAEELLTATRKPSAE